MNKQLLVILLKIFNGGEITQTNEKGKFFWNGNLQLQRLSIRDFLNQLDKRHNHRFIEQHRAESVRREVTAEASKTKSRANSHISTPSLSSTIDLGLLLYRRAAADRQTLLSAYAMLEFQKSSKHGETKKKN